MDTEIPQFLIDQRKAVNSLMKINRNAMLEKRLKVITFSFLWLVAVVAIIKLFLITSEPLSYVAPEPEHYLVKATITAYTSSVDETDDTPFITASGARTKRGVIACPPKYDFGQVVIIKDEEYICEDRMNRRYHSQERFDVWVETKSEAFAWGVKELPVKVLLASK